MTRWRWPTGRPLQTLLDATARINIWEGSVRSAKTVTSLHRWFEFVAREATDGPLLMAGQTRDTVYRNCISVLEEIYPGRVEWNAGTSTATILGRPCWVLGGGDIRGYRKLRGVTLAGAYVDEATLVTEDFWTMLISRLSLPGAKVFATTNPDSPTHWLHRDWLTRDGIDVRRLRLNIDDNPWLDPTYVSAVKTEYEGVWRRRFILGEWVTAAGAIWPQLDPALHVTDTSPPLRNVVEAVDYGTVNPFVALLIGIGVDEDETERVHVAAEWRWDSSRQHRQRTDTEYVQELQTWRRAGWRSPAWADHPPRTVPVDAMPDRVIVDPSAASFITAAQPVLRRVQGADNRVIPGVRSVSSLLAADRIRIHESCRRLLEEAQGYGWDDKAARRGDEKPVKDADHGCVAAGTLIDTDRGLCPVESVEAGVRVWTRDGWRRVEAAGCTDPAASVFRVVVDDGRRLTATGNHPVWTPDGWKRVDALRYGDIIPRWNPPPAPSTESPTVATPTQPTTPTGSTTPPESTTARTDVPTSTVTSGNTTTAPSPTGTTSTTSTRTPSTTDPSTSSASHPSYMPPSTLPTNELEDGPKRTSPRWRKPGLLLPSGIEAPPVVPGTVITPAVSGRPGSLSLEPVTIAATTSTRSPAGTRSGSAPTLANQHGVVRPVSTTNPGRVDAAHDSLRSTSTRRPGSVHGRVVSVTPLAGRVPVFNLAVEGRPEFVADGVLVHNCDALRYGVMALWSQWRRWLTTDPTT